MYLTSLPANGYLASGGVPVPKSGRLDPSDPEYQRIQRDAAALFDDEPAVSGSPATPVAARDIGDAVADILAANRSKMPTERDEPTTAPAPAPKSDGDLGDSVADLMAASRGKSYPGASK